MSMKRPDFIDIFIHRCYESHMTAMLIFSFMTVYWNRAILNLSQNLII